MRSFDLPCPRQSGFTFKNFVFFMVKSRCVLAACSNPGMVLTLHVSLSPENGTVELNFLYQYAPGQPEPQLYAGKGGHIIDIATLGVEIIQRSTGSQGKYSIPGANEVGDPP